jgi:phosphoribosylglycinamide formyltransferase 1
MSARLAMLVSGGGRSLENLAEVIARGELDARIGLVLSSSAEAFALQRARRLGLEHTVVLPREHAETQHYSRAVFDAVEARGCDLVVLAGFLRLLIVPQAWVGRVLNIHPALLPAFGGKGFYGQRVHRAVLESGVPVTGCTVHYVTNEYDAGPIVLQRSIEVRAGDDEHTLAERVFEEERRALPEAIRQHLSGAVALVDGRVVRCQTP